MKNIKKIFSLMVAFVMMFGLALTTVHAEDTCTITVTSPHKDEVYKLYKLLNATSNGQGAVSYTVNDKWSSILTKTAIEGATTTATDEAEKLQYAFGQVFSIDEAGNVTAKTGVTDDSNDLKALAQAVKSYVNSEVGSSIAATDTQTASSTTTGADGTVTVDSVVFSNLQPGYYFVTTTAGSLVMMDTTTSANAIIEEKNEVPSFEKELANNDAQTTPGVGDTKTYVITVGQTNGVATNVVVSDTMSTGLTFNNDIVVKQGGTTLTPGAAPAGESPATGDYYLATNTNKTFELHLTKAGLTKLSSNLITITYSGTVNANAVTVDNLNNNATLEYGNGTTVNKQVEMTKPASIDIFKYAKDANDENINLQGAVFSLEKADSNNKYTAVTLTSKTDNNGTYYLPKTGDESEESPTSDSNGHITIAGLSAGTYRLTETTAPNGYNKLTDTLVFTVSVSGTVTTVSSGQFNQNSTFYTNDPSDSDLIKVQNTAGAQLPSTGGSGTTMMYIAGGALLVGAVVLLITRKRVSE